uniref:Putative RdRp n=1 Tax=Diversispora mitovirus B TaxID=2592741 RepID=A0A7G3W8T5_9VIRU|nr:putative RdRp [Diversispora mitovirus B]
MMGSINGMIVGNYGRPLLKVLLYFPSVLGIKSSIFMVKTLLRYASTLNRMRKQSGMTFVVKYLKACHVLLQQSICGQKLSDTGSLGARVSRTRGGGLPSLIPLHHRESIRKGNKMIIRLWLSLFSVYRVIDIPGKVKLSTITDASTADLGRLGEFSQFTSIFYKWIKDKWSSDGSISDALWEGPLDFLKGLRAKPFMISKSTPVTLGQGGVKVLSTSPLAILLSARVWKSDYARALFPLLEAWCKMTGNIWVLNRMELWSKGPADPRDQRLTITKRGEVISGGQDLMEVLPEVGRRFSVGFNFVLGKLGFKAEAAGKVRVFAMVDCFTQWLLEPLHKAVFQTLRLIPQDGTYDQVKPLDHLVDRQRKLQEDCKAPGSFIPRVTKRLPGDVRNAKAWALYSFDLSSATDRLPLVFQKALLSPILGAWGAEVWGCLLVAREYMIPKRADLGIKPTKVMYATGQPMGALSSWALLALIHHCIVQWSWYRVLRNRGQKLFTWYEDYAVLGDDVVILGSDVATAYVEIMEALGVSISLHKSLISPKGKGFEFAKRTFLDGVDVSAVSLLECLVSRAHLPNLLELVKKYNLTLGRYLSFLGYGYRAKGGANARLQTLPRRLRNYIVAFCSPSMPSFPGLRNWLALRSWGNSYSQGEAKVSAMILRFIENEKKALLEFLDRIQPLVAEAKRLGTVSRDRVHYGTAPRPASRVYIHAGVSAEVDQTIVDSLNETVYREAFLDVVCDARDLRAEAEELGVGELPDIEALWDKVSEMESRLGALPLPRSLLVSAGIKPSAVVGSDLKKWELYSRTFRSTKSQ